MKEIITNVDAGKYKFRIIDHSDENDGKTYKRNFKIGGNTYQDCVNVSIIYDTAGNPVSAKIPTLVHDPECSLSSTLDRGEGSIAIIKTLLRHVNSVIPTITLFEFEDMSNIECGTEEEKHRKRHRKRGTYAVPTALYYFSIAFNGITWYEKHFNAYYKSQTEHAKYRTKVEKFLTEEKMLPFDDFLRIAQPSEKIKDELELLYKEASSYKVFFDSIPHDDKCRLVRDWIASFMENRLNNIFFNKGWVIDVTKMDTPPEIPASLLTRKANQKNQKAGSRRKRVTKKSARYYCPKGRINLSRIAYDMGA